VNERHGATVAGVILVEQDWAERIRNSRKIEQQARLRLLGAFGQAAEALVWLERNVPDVLVTDVDFPDGCGLALVRECNQRHPECKILVRTTGDRGNAVHSSIEAGANGFLLKEAPDGCISNGVLSMLDGGSPISAAIARKLFERLRMSHDDGAAMAPLPAAVAPDAAIRLTRREAQILQLIARGDLYQQIASTLDISIGTMQSHVKNLYRKLDVHSRSEAICKSHERGIVRFTQP
jgi:DNA-binding NarL/FixJ family response regulator